MICLLANLISPPFVCCPGLQIFIWGRYTCLRGTYCSSTLPRNCQSAGSLATVHSVDPWHAVRFQQLTYILEGCAASVYGTWWGDCGAQVEKPFIFYQSCSSFWWPLCSAWFYCLVGKELFPGISMIQSALLEDSLPLNVELVSLVFAWTCVRYPGRLIVRLANLPDGEAPCNIWDFWLLPLIL